MARANEVLAPERAALIGWVARIGVVTASAAAAREGSTIASARGRLLAGERAGLLARWRPLADGPSLFSATRAGLRAAGLRELEPARVSAANAAHATVCAAVAVALERAYPQERLSGERELRAEERARGAALASIRLRGGPLHRPDLVLWPHHGSSLPIAVEVELTVKAPRRLLEICQAWARCRCVAGVLYVAAPEVRRPLARAIDQADAAAQIVVVATEVLDCREEPARDPIARTIPVAS